MTTIIPVSTAIFSNRLAVSMPRYAQIVEYAEPAFFGVSHPINKEYQCREIWSHDQRIAVYRALQNAQSKVEAVAEYPVLPTWIGPERHPLANPVVLNVGKLIQMGQKAIISHANVPNASIVDPAIFICAGIATTDINEIHIYHPGTHVEIYPSEITIIGGTVTITVPLVRMVAIAFENTPPEGLDYADYATWAENLVDIEEEYLDPTLPPVEFISYDCATDCSCPPETVTDGCAVIRDAEMSIVQVATLGCACIPGITRFADMYYQAGLVGLTSEAEDILVRLAHALMPNEPCGCDQLKGRWRGDQLVPDVLTAERENCPWGLSQGSWTAWRFAQSIKQLRMGVI